MGHNSQAGQVGFKTQDVKGTYKNPGAASPNQGVFMRLRGGALGANRDLIIPDPEIGGNRDVPDAYLGSVGYSGDLDFYARMEGIATLLYGALGAKSSSTTGATTATVGTHVLTPADALPWLSIEEAIASSFETFRYTDSKVNTLHLEVAANGYLMGTAGMVALTQLAGATRTAVPDWDTTPMIVGTNVVVNWGGAALPAKTWSMDINNNLETDDFRLGALGLGDAIEHRREVTFGVTIRPADSTLWRTAVYGSGAATAPVGGASAKSDLHVVASSYEVIGTSVTVYSLDIAVPVASIAPFQLGPSGDDAIEHTLEIRALRPDPAVGLMTATVKNGLAAVF